MKNGELTPVGVVKNGELTPVGVAKSIWFSGVKHCALVFCLVAMLLAGYVVESHAKEKNTQQYSKDYKAFPSESPEAVVTSFVEYADLGKNANRQADERYPLFWSLTELSEVPDNSQRLIIKSYKIDGKNTLPSGDVIVRLTMDVRAIALSSCDPKDHSGYKYQKNNCDWRERIVVIHNSSTKSKNRLSAANTKTFIQYVFGDSETATKILSKDKGIYAIPKATREWTFEIRLVKKKGKWLISQDSVPIEVAYIDEEVKMYKESIRQANEDMEICDGKRAPDKNSFYYSKEFRSARCKNNKNNLLRETEYLSKLEYAKVE